VRITRQFSGIFRSGTLPSSQNAIIWLASCDMATLYLRNVPEEVSERLGRLAAREGMSVSAFASRELAAIARRADNAALLADLPDLGVDAEGVVAAVWAGRPRR
jgi:plasmid stability protein